MMNINAITPDVPFVRFAVTQLLSQANVLKQEGSAWKIRELPVHVPGVDLNQTFNSKDDAIDRVIVALYQQYQGKTGKSTAA